MFSSPVVRKVVRVATTSTIAGATLAFVFLGGAADAAEVSRVITLGRGYN